RWVFDTRKVTYMSVDDSVVRARKLREHFKVIVLPDQSPHELFDGLPRQYPAPYAGGLGQEGVEALRQFVTDGGTLVALNDASRFVVEHLLLPVRNVLESVADDEFYAPGSIFRLELDPSDPIARGMPAQSVAWYESGPAFEVLDSSAARVVARYPADADKVLLSGWVLHPERVAGRAAPLRSLPAGAAATVPVNQWRVWLRPTEIGYVQQESWRLPPTANIKALYVNAWAFGPRNCGSSCASPMRPRSTPS